MMVVRFESVVVGRGIRLWTLMMDGGRAGEMEFVKHVMEGPVTANAARVRYGGFGILLLFPRSAPIVRTILTSRKHPPSAWPNRQTRSYMTYPTRGERSCHLPFAPCESNT